jgi:predicted HAD superfamily hydrolase
MLVLPQITYDNMALIFLCYLHGYKKMKYLQTIGIHSMILNVATE